MASNAVVYNLGCRYYLMCRHCKGDFLRNQNVYNIWVGMFP